MLRESRGIFRWAKHSQLGVDIEEGLKAEGI